MKLFQSLLFSVLFVSALIFTGCNEEQTTSVMPDTNTPSLSKLTLPDGAVISSATFNIYVEDGQDHNITVHQVNVPWVEATETWNIFFGKPADQFETASLGNFTATGGLKTVDITALVQGWVDGTIENNGVLLNQPDIAAGLIGYRSKEYGDGSSAPFLEVTYTVGIGAPVTIKEPAFGDTYISTLFPGTPYGSNIYLLNGRPAVDYIKYVLVQFDIESTPEEECYQDETAWAANGDVPGSKRYTTRGNWATYLDYAAKTVNIYAGQNILVGTATLSAESGGNVTITITLNAPWALDGDVIEGVKIQGYSSAPSGNPSPGLFTTYKGNDLTVVVPYYAYYGIHLDVSKVIDCPDL